MPVAWVTGARGFIGQHLVLTLRDDGFTVCGIGHGHLPAESWAEAGLTSWLNSQLGAEALGQLAAAEGLPDLVFHLAGGSTVGASLQAPFEDFTRTTHTTASLLEWLRNNAPGARLVVASSAAVYGDTRGVPADEARRPAPVSPYGYHKLMMEQLCEEYSRIFGVRTAILRLFSVYGEGLRKQLLWDCAGKLLGPGDSIELGGTGEELRDWVHVDDAALMMLRLAPLASPECPIINGGSGIGITVREVVTVLAAALRSPKRIEFSQARRRGDPTVLVADAARLAALGYRSKVPLSAGVSRYADWFRATRNP